MLVHPLSGDNIFYKVRDANHIVLIDSVGNEPQKEVKKNYILKKKGCNVNNCVNHYYSVTQFIFTFLFFENYISCVAFFLIISTALSTYSINKSTTFKI